MNDDSAQLPALIERLDAIDYDTRNSWLGDVEVSPPCREAAQPRNAREEA